MVNGYVHGSARCQYLRMPRKRQGLSDNRWSGLLECVLSESVLEGSADVPGAIAYRCDRQTRVNFRAWSHTAATLWRGCIRTSRSCAWSHTPISPGCCSYRRLRTRSRDLDAAREKEERLRSRIKNLGDRRNNYKEPGSAPAGDQEKGNGFTKKSATKTSRSGRGAMAESKASSSSDGEGGDDDRFSTPGAASGNDGARDSDAGAGRDRGGGGKRRRLNELEKRVQVRLGIGVRCLGRGSRERGAQGSGLASRYVLAVLFRWKGDTHAVSKLLVGSLRLWRFGSIGFVLSAMLSTTALPFSFPLGWLSPPPPPVPPSFEPPSPFVDGR